MKIALILMPFLISFAGAQTESQSFSLEEILDRTQQGPQIDCFDPAQTPACEDITKQHCDNLSRNQGRMNTSDGSINIGKSQRSQLSELERASMADLVRVLPNLPADIQREIRRPVTELGRLLARETDNRDWYRSVTRARDQIADGIKDAAARRASASLRQRLPRGQRATSADTTAERDRQERLIMSDLTRVKMETSPNWSRLQNVLTRVKEDMLAVVNTLPLTPAEKAERIERINQTQLTTPFGVRLGGQIGRVIEQDCRTNMVNAMYMDLTNSLTVCAGFVNGYQSESTLYFTLAHELAHSFNLKFLQDASSEPRFSRLDKRLAETNANLPCDEYRRLLAPELIRAGRYECGRPEYNNFVQCLNGNIPTLPPPNDFGMAASALAQAANFCEVTDPAQGLAYLNPNEFVDRKFPSLISSLMQEFTDPTPTRARQILSPAYTIVQEHRCRPGVTCEEHLNTALRRFNSPSARPACSFAAEGASENESDWYAHKAMTIRLRATSDIRQRRELVASSMGLFCDFNYTRKPDDSVLENLAHELAQIAQAEANDNHSSHDDRISAVMTEDMASLLQCTRPEGAGSSSSYQACRL